MSDGRPPSSAPSEERPDMVLSPGTRSYLRATFSVVILVVGILALSVACKIHALLDES